MARRLRQTSAAGILSLCCALAVPAVAHAAGFQLNEMSAASLGNAHAGMAASDDLSTIFFNPAGLSLSSGRLFTASAFAIRPSAEFENRGSVSALGTPLTGGNGGDAGKWAPVPALYYATDLGYPGLRLGLGLQVPFGLSTEYESGWVGRYQALKSSLMTVNISPVVSYQVNERLALGAGVSAQYVDVELTRAIDFGAACAATAGAAACAGAGLRPQASDGLATVKGKDWAFGFNLGAVFTPAAGSRVGVAYRSKISHSLTGDARFDKPAGLPGPLAASPSFTNTGARAGIDLPESVSVSGQVELDARWTLLADATWTHWSRFNELRVRFDNGAPDNVTAEEWRNTVRLSLAANYRLNERWKLRGGVAWDPSPVRTEFRTPRIPDNDRTWLAFGVQYRLSPNASWDVGYAHLFVKDAAIDKREPPLGGRLTGEYSSSVNILSVQYNHAF